MRRQDEDSPEAGRAIDFENPAWSVVVFILAFLASLIVSARIDNHYYEIVQMVRSWIK